MDQRTILKIRTIFLSSGDFPAVQMPTQWSLEFYKGIDLDKERGFTSPKGWSFIFLFLIFT